MLSLSRSFRVRDEELDHGFTLIELLVVILIIGILAAIAVPVFLNQRRKGWDAAVQSDLRNAATAEETALVQTGLYTDAVAKAETASAATMVALEAVGFEYSTARNYDNGVPKIRAAVDAGSSFCLSARSASGDYWSLGSASGLQDTGNVQKSANADGTCTP